LVTQLRAYLDTRRVQRVAIPLIVVAALTIVAVIFLSSASKRPITELAPEVAPAPPEPPSHVAIHINSEPSGAEVVRLSDNRQLGTTPTMDIEPADGRQVNYRFHLAGYGDVQMAFQAKEPGKSEITALLSAPERKTETASRSGGGSGRHSAHGHDKKPLATQPAAAPGASTAALPKAAPAAPTRENAALPGTLPPLGDRNPVRRLGH
jgi:hypothetical protein